MKLLNYSKEKPTPAEQAAAEAKFKEAMGEAQPDGLFQKPPVKVNHKKLPFEGEMKYWVDLLARLGEEGSEDIRKLMSDLGEMINNGEDMQVIGERFAMGLMRYAVVQAYERPVVAANSENFSMRMPIELLEKMDSAIAAGSARNRSEFVRTLLEVTFANADAATINYRMAFLETVGLLLRNPEEILIFQLIRSFLDRPDVGGVSKMLASIARPLSEILAAVGGGGVERVQDMINELFQATHTLRGNSQESEDAVHNVE